MENYSKERITAEIRQIISSEIFKLKESIFAKKELEDIQKGVFLTDKKTNQESKGIRTQASTPIPVSFLKSSAPDFNYNVWVAANGVARQVSIVGELVAEGKEKLSALGA